jgi:hypothetical protein
MPEMGLGCVDAEKHDVIFLEHLGSFALSSLRYRLVLLRDSSLVQTIGWCLFRSWRTRVDLGPPGDIASGDERAQGTCDMRRKFGCHVVNPILDDASPPRAAGRSPRPAA